MRRVLATRVGGVVEADDALAILKIPADPTRITGRTARRNDEDLNRARIDDAFPLRCAARPQRDIAARGSHSAPKGGTRRRRVAVVQNGGSGASKTEVCAE